MTNRRHGLSLSEMWKNAVTVIRSFSIPRFSAGISITTPHPVTARKGNVPQRNPRNRWHKSYRTDYYTGARLGWHRCECEKWESHENTAMWSMPGDRVENGTMRQL